MSFERAVNSLTKGRGYVKRVGLKLAGLVDRPVFCLMQWPQVFGGEKGINLELVRSRQTAQNELRWREWIIAMAMVGGIPGTVSATHEADHRFTVEGFVCGADGRGSAGIDVLVKDTRISYGQIVKTDGDGYYKAAFHLHNDNLGDPLLVEARGEQQQHKITFDPKDLEAERRIQVNFGTGCIRDRESPPQWIYWVLGAVVAMLGAVVGARAIRAGRKREQKRGKSQGKRGK